MIPKVPSSSMMKAVRKKTNLGACVVGIGDVSKRLSGRKGFREALERAELVSAFSNRVGIVTCEGVQLWALSQDQENEDPTRTNGPLSFKIPKKLTGARMIVKELSLGIDHGAYLTSEGILFTFGNDRYGQLGHGFESCKEPRRVRALSSRIVSRVCCGQEHTMAIAEGQVFVWGKSRDGRLGLGSSVEPSVGTPRLLAELRDVCDVAAGKTHSLALIRDGRLYAWGWGPDGQLGLGDMCTQTGVPKLVSMPSSKVVPRSVACSERYSTAIVFSCTSSSSEKKDQEGILMAWGSIWQPQKITRKAYHTTVKVSKRSWTPVPLPSMPKVSRVVCGSNHLLYISGKRRHLHVTAWGRAAIEISSTKRKSCTEDLKGRVLHVTKMHRPLALSKNDEAFSARNIACGKDFALCTVIPCVNEKMLEKKELARTLTKEEAAKIREMTKCRNVTHLQESFARMAEQFQTKILDRTNRVCDRVSNQSRLVRMVTNRLREDRENDDVIVELREENNRLRDDMKCLEETLREDYSRLEVKHESVVKQNEKLETENSRLREQIARFERLQRENTKLREETERRNLLVREQCAETETHLESLRYELDVAQEKASEYQQRYETMECEAAETSCRLSEAARDSLLSVESQHERRRSSLLKLTQALEEQQEAQEATLHRLQEDLFAQREMHSMMNEDEVAHEQMLSKLLPSLTKLEEDNNQLREIAYTEETAAQEALRQARREHTEAVSAVMELETSREETRRMLETEIRLAQDRDTAVQLAEEFERKFELMESSSKEEEDTHDRVSKCADADTEALSIRNNELRLQLKRIECEQYTTRRNMRMDVTIVRRILGQTLSLLRGRTLVKYAHGRGGGIANRFVSLHCARALNTSLDSDNATWVVGSIVSQYSSKEHWSMQWSNVNRNGKIATSKPKVLRVTDIREITYGAESENFQRRRDKKKEIHNPWLCFSVYTDTRSFDFAAENSREAMEWVEVLRFLTGLPMQGIGRMLWKCAFMRMQENARRCQGQA